MPKTNRTTDRAHVIMSFDLNQRDFEDFVSEVKSSKYFPNLIGLEVKRPNYGNPVIGLGALLLRKFPEQDDDYTPSLEENGVPQMDDLSDDSTDSGTEVENDDKEVDENDC